MFVELTAEIDLPKTYSLGIHRVESRNLPMRKSFLLFVLLTATSSVLAQTPKPAALLPMRAEDIVATVEGQTITRRELTYFWLQTDPKTQPLLGELLADAWKRNQTATTYTVPVTAIFQKLYGTDPNAYATILSSLVTTKLVGFIAQKQKIVITKAQSKAYAHELLDTVRKQSNSKLSDDALLKQFKIPRDVFEKDMMFRLQVEQLMARSLAKRNGHPISTQDWVVTRELFAQFLPGTTPEQTEINAKVAKARLDTWLAEVKAGKSVEQAAREHNENNTKQAGGSRGAVLRGTGTAALETVIFALKPGELSAPIRAANGWYVFQVEKSGSAVTAEERKLGWQTVLNAKQPQFLYELREAAKIKSVIELPLPDPAKTQ